MKKSITVLLAVVLSFALMSIAYGADRTLKKGKHLENEIACVDCHKTKTPTSAPEIAVCEGCHPDMADSDAVEMQEKGKTSKVFVHDPHEPVPNGCTDCHKMHGDSVLYCNEKCHAFTNRVP